MSDTPKTVSAETQHEEVGHVHGPGCRHHHHHHQHMTMPFVRSEAKVGRNDTCPCGSGKKFKKCCQKVGKDD